MTDLFSLLPESLQMVNNIMMNDGRVITAGMLTQEEFAPFAQFGIKLIINLMPDDNNKEYQNEADLAEANGMEYIYIPVDWSKPTLENMAQFFEAMRENQNKKILLHCLINYRASAFYYFYLLTQTVTKDAIRMEEIMQPWGDLEQSFEQYPQWKVFLENVRKKYNK